MIIQIENLLNLSFLLHDLVYLRSVYDERMYFQNW